MIIAMTRAIAQPEEVCIQDQIYLGPNQYGAGMMDPFQWGIGSLNTPVFDVFSTPCIASQSQEFIDERNGILRAGTSVQVDHPNIRGFLRTSYYHLTACILGHKPTPSPHVILPAEGHSKSCSAVTHSNHLFMTLLAWILAGRRDWLQRV